MDFGADRHGDKCRAVVRRAGEEVRERRQIASTLDPQLSTLNPQLSTLTLSLSLPLSLSLARYQSRPPPAARPHTTRPPPPVEG